MGRIKPNTPCGTSSYNSKREASLLLQLGNTFLLENNNDEAIVHYKKAIEIDPNYKDAYYNLGNCYQENDEAIIHYKKVLELDSNYKEAYYNLGICYQETKNNDEAIIHYKNAIELDSNYKKAYNNLGNCYQETNNYYEAMIHYKQTIEIDPNYKEAYNNLGICYYKTKNNDEAIIHYKKAIELDPNYKEAYNNLAYVYLFNKDYKEGFKLYEYRFLNRKNDACNRIYRSIDLPSWNGINAENRVLIVWEQGFGDSFQFFRFIIPLKQKYPNTSFTFLCHKKIGHLFKNIIPIITEVADSSIYDYKLALMTIPHILELTDIQPYTAESYIKVNSDKLSFWEKKLSTLPPNYKIGLCWKGNNTTSIEKYIPLQLFKNISELNVNLISLQKGDGEEELDTSTFQHKINRFEIDAEQSFTDTVAILKSLDLFITVDTSMVHLAGILGIKTLLILGYVSEWRWGREGKDTYWYNSVEVVRSNKIGDWTGVLEEIKQKLEREVRSYDPFK
jgi:tetratricopeptide (TPR) repeat protein